MPIYAVTNQYLPLVDFQINSPTFLRRLSTAAALLFSNRPVIVTQKNLISTQDLLAVRNTGKPWLVCGTLEEATAVAALMLKPHNTTPDFIESGVLIFATPVIFKFDTALEIDKLADVDANTLSNYQDTANIPAYQHDKYFDQSIVQSKINILTKSSAPLPKIAMQDLTGNEPQEALYIGSKGVMYRSNLFKMPGANYLWSRP